MSNDPKSVSYNLGLYRDHEFNHVDFSLRSEVGLYAEQPVRKEEISTVL